MGYSVEAILLAFPDGLTISQLKAIIKKAGYSVGCGDLLKCLRTSDQVINRKSRWYRITNAMRDVTTF